MTNLEVKAVESALGELNTVEFSHIRTKWRLATWLTALEPALKAIEATRLDSVAKYLKKYKARLNGQDKDAVAELVPGTPEHRECVLEYNLLMELPTDVKLNKIKQSWIEEYSETGPHPTIAALSAILAYVEDDSEETAPKEKK